MIANWVTPCVSKAMAESRKDYSFAPDLWYLPPPAEMGWGRGKGGGRHGNGRPGQAGRRSPTPLPPGAQPLNAEEEAIAWVLPWGGSREWRCYALSPDEGRATELG